MKKIIFVIKYFLNGGAERRCVTLANYFLTKGYSVDIAVIYPISGERFFDIGRDIRIVQLEEYNAALSQTRDYRRYTAAQKRRISAIKKLGYLLKALHIPVGRSEDYVRLIRMRMQLHFYLKENPDATVIALGAHALEAVTSACKKLHKLIFAAINSAQTMEFFNKTSFRRRIRSVKAADAVIIQTGEDQAFYSRYHPKVYVINNPLNPDLPQPYHGKRNPIIVNFCRISPQKNLDLLLDAFMLLIREYPEYAVHIYGNIISVTEQQLKDRLLRRISENRLEDSFHILPGIADVHTAVRDAAMFVSTSDYEGMSNSMLESMAIGLPCICTDCRGGGVREVMRDHENGLIVPIDDVSALYHAMKESIENPSLAEKLSANACKIRTRLSVDTIAGEWLRIIETI